MITIHSSLSMCLFRLVELAIDGLPVDPRLDRDYPNKNLARACMNLAAATSNYLVKPAAPFTQWLEVERRQSWSCFSPVSLYRLLSLSFLL